MNTSALCTEANNFSSSRNSVIEVVGGKTTSVILAPMNFLTDENIKLRIQESAKENVREIPLSEESLEGSTEVSELMA